MANNDITQQLEEWKKKYYSSLNELEKQQSYDELLQRSLGRLALAAQGLDPLLDRQLSSLRKVLRGKNNQVEIEHILEQMEKAIAKMEESKVSDKTQSNSKILAELLASLKIPKIFKIEKKSLLKQLRRDNNDASSVMPEILALLNKCLPDHPSKSSGFLGGLFNSGNSSKDTKLDSAAEEIVLDDESFSNKLSSNLVLIQLLERIALPTNLSKKATKIRHQLEPGIDDDQLPAVINDIADIMSTLGSQAVTEKQEYEKFLQTLTERLNELDQHISQASNEEIKAIKERDVISQAVKDQVSGLRTHVENSGDLEQLKSSVNNHLDTLNQHFEQYKKSDHDQFDKSQKQINELNKRLKDMEKESHELREAVKKSRKSALKDTLTGIWNRQALNEIMEKEYDRWQRYQRPLSIVIWDIDFFKRVNDSYGHDAGDKVLKTIARIFQQATRDADFIARFGGEEFVGVFPETRLEDALALANKIREKIATSKFHYEQKPVPITASAGLATFRPGDSIEDVFKRADKALYQAKGTGRNRCIAD
ncbi:MAG: diguanylate cyclase [Piscirickettsiaceae bacterium]|nr:diguanylate cyclase [Piscirickettsiaceae bacterium]